MEKEKWKMMEEWGYEAKKGLGAEQQGMTEPITLK